MRPLFLKIMDYVFLSIIVGAVTLASCNKLSYAQSVHPHGELALAGYQVSGTQSAPTAAFLCELSMQSHVMAKLEGEAFALAGNHLHQSANPFQLCHPHLAVNGKASITQVNGAH